MKANRPMVGVGVIVMKDDLILMDKRRNAHGDGDWSVPGGHLEFGESLEQCAAREALEETGVKISNIRFLTVTNDVFDKENKHYITVWMVSDHASGEATVTEPDKFESVSWFKWNNMPSPLFLPTRNLLKSGINPMVDG